MTIVRSLCAALAVAVSATPVLGAQQLRAAADSTTPAAHASAVHASLFTRRELWIGAAFAGATAAMFATDRSSAVEMQEPEFQGDRGFRHLAAFGRFMGGEGFIIGTAALYGVGRLAHLPRAAAIGLHTGEAILVAGVTTLALKTLAGRERPSFAGVHDPADFGIGRGYRERDASFPSGHTTVAFAAASAITAETSHYWPHSVWYVAPIMYGTATLVGVSRVYNNNHWSSDVMMGAAIGTLSGLTVVRWNRLHPGNRFDRIFLPSSVVPVRGGVAMAWRETW